MLVWLRPCFTFLFFCFFFNLSPECLILGNLPSEKQHCGINTSLPRTACGPPRRGSVAGVLVVVWHYHKKKFRPNASSPWKDDCVGTLVKHYGRACAFECLFQMSTPLWLAKQRCTGYGDGAGHLYLQYYLGGHICRARASPTGRPPPCVWPRRAYRPIGGTCTYR